MWRAIRNQFPGIAIRGCAFHFSQALLRKAREVRIYNEAKTDDVLLKIWDTCRFLHWLPANHVDLALRELEALAQRTARFGADHGAHAFLAYVRSEWVESTVYPPESWSSFGAEVRTNNHCEGYHRGLNQGLGELPKYFQVLEYFGKEAARTARKISDQDLTRRVSSRQTRMDRAIKELQARYRTDPAITVFVYLHDLKEIFLAR